jgi:ribosome-interacting GTPase 1
LGILKAKLAKLKAEVLLGDKSAGSGGGVAGFDVSKSGDTRVGLVGFPSVGKSTLLTVLTGTFSEVAAYEFTTLTAIPGVIQYRGAKIQLVDLPGLIEGAKDGKGRGRQIIGVSRGKMWYGLSPFVSGLTIPGNDRPHVRATLFSWSLMQASL